jgi:NAD(P)-dependent dehydrogenase (short-subunit alcohol dehydrogenase family)
MMLKDKIAVITGIGPGMGTEIARLFARQGAALVIGARTESKIRQLAEELQSEGCRVIAQVTDLNDKDSCHGVVQAAIDEFGGVDILVQNGHHPGDYKTIDEADPGQWREVMDCNFFGALHLVQACTPSMVTRGGGQIILVNSGASFEPHIGLASYAASKAALESLVRSIAIELGPKGIRANGIHLGLVEGENVDSWVAMLADSQQKSADVVRSEIIAREYPVGHIPTPEECAGTVLFLASELSAPIIGQAIMVNGGALLR